MTAPVWTFRVLMSRMHAEVCVLDETKAKGNPPRVVVLEMCDHRHDETSIEAMQAFVAILSKEEAKSLGKALLEAASKVRPKSLKT